MTLCHTSLVSPPLENECPLRVLCVEDDDAVAAVVQYVLSLAGYCTERAIDGVEGYERLCSRRPPVDLVITDHHMPRMSGRQLVEKLHADHFDGEIIVHSAALPAAELTAYRALGIKYLLNKPTDLDRLLTAVKEIVVARPGLFAGPEK